jgi:hypothetical protein
LLQVLVIQLEDDPRLRIGAHHVGSSGGLGEGRRVGRHKLHFPFGVNDDVTEVELPFFD